MAKVVDRSDANRAQSEDLGLRTGASTPNAGGQRNRILRRVAFSEEFSKEPRSTGRYLKSERRRVGVGLLSPFDLAPTTPYTDGHEDDELKTPIKTELEGSVSRSAGVPSATRRQMVFVTSVVVVAASVLVSSLLFPKEGSWLNFGSRPLLAALATVAYLLTDARPVGVRRRVEGVHYTASWAFPAALALLLPESTFLVDVAAVTFISGLINFKPLVRNLFNAAQAVVSTFAVFEILWFFSAQKLLMGGIGRFGFEQLVGMVIAFMVGTSLNHLIVGIVVSLGQGRLFVRSSWYGSLHEVAQGVTLMSLGAVVAFGMVWSLWFFPILAIVTYALVTNTYNVMKARIEQGRDELTGLAGRGTLMERLNATVQDAAKRGTGLGFVVFNLDSFKSINDRLGHSVGDAVLKQVAERLDECVGVSGFVARLGGNEFGVIVPSVEAVTAVEGLARRIQNILDQPVEIKGFPLRVSASFGIAMYPEHGTDAETIARAADVAMYQAKTERSGLEVFDNSTDRFQPSKVGLLGDLRYAAARGELFLLYQPKLDLTSDKVVAVEALIRWQHPTLGLIQPNDFITMAEHTELMVDLTKWVLGEALKACANWRAMGFDVGVAINGSARNLHDMAFPRLVEAALIKSGVPASHLEIEITENTVMSDYRRSQLVLGELKSMGIELSVDDFGTGYSSLQHLRDLPVSTVKIDKTFVLAMLAQGSDAVIVRSIIDLSSNLGLKCVAEGVETEPILARLKLMGCSFAQGYHIARPLSEEKLLEWLQVRSDLQVAQSASSRRVRRRVGAVENSEI